MAASLQKFSDESLSKTINMPAGSKIEEVAKTYIAAYESGMSGVTIYKWYT
jgi:ribonucleoside-diphosphate reductase alpha chain